MIKFNLYTFLLGTVLIIGIVSCGPSLVLQNVDYAQPIESVLSPDSNNVVYDERYAVEFSISPLLEEEGISSVNEIRLIRNSTGHYFVTANGFSHVYIFFPAEAVLELQNKISFETGLGEPAFNQRNDYIEMVDLASGEVYRLDHEGIQEDEE